MGNAILTMGASIGSSIAQSVAAGLSGVKIGVQMPSGGAISPSTP
jgi:hypothetical protein